MKSFVNVKKNAPVIHTLNLVRPSGIRDKNYPSFPGGGSLEILENS